MANYAQGIFTPLHPEKYIGKGTIKYRSSWEMAFMSMLDNHSGVLNWASESISIPYRNPLTGKQTIYVPDFFIYSMDANGTKNAEILEIKPKRETTMEAAKTYKDKLAVAINTAKWAAAKAFCARHGLTFKVVTEDQLFFQGKKK